MRADDEQVVEILLAHQGADVGGRVRGKRGRQLDDHAPGRQVHVQGVLGIERAPVGRFGGLDHVGHRGFRRQFLVLFGRRGRRGKCGGRSAGQQRQCGNGPS
ncbi:hypothetical protein [Massilia sp. LjRoot122]|uniref:hypothetical protein n=1 Tax=Massilia sp. LjRoot122 TaxID=3342257 RepID=UPI003F4FE1B5